MSTRFPKDVPPSNWQDATAITIGRIQQIFSLEESLLVDEKILLYARAHEAVQAQGKIASATEYWNTFVNVLRTLVAGLTNCDPKTTFD